VNIGRIRPIRVLSLPNFSKIAFEMSEPNSKGEYPCIAPVASVIDACHEL
jgi:hypothetical protein